MHEVMHAHAAVPILLAGLKTLIPLAGAHVPFASSWKSHDGMVRGHYNAARDLVYVEADFGHEPADVKWAYELLLSRGWVPTDNPMDDELLEDGVRVYFEKVEEM